MPFRFARICYVPVAMAVLALGGCQSAWEDRTRDAARPVVLVEGTYKGEVALVSASGPQCPGGAAGIIVLGDGRLIHAHSPRHNFVALIGADGGVRASAGDATLEGQVGVGQLGFTVRSPGCESRYTLRWVM